MGDPSTLSRDLGLSGFEYTGEDQYSKTIGELMIGAGGARFVLPRERKTRSYKVMFDLQWPEVVSYDCCKVSICKDEKSWPIDEELPAGYEVIGTAGMLFVYLIIEQSANFQIWAYFPYEDVDLVKELAERYIGRPSIPGLAHHGTAAVVKYIVDRCQVLSSIKSDWQDWLHKSPSSPMSKAREKLREIGPTYHFCLEGMAIDFYGASAQLEQMSTFWPWRAINNIYLDDVEILYQWFEDSFIYRQQVWADDSRQAILDAARDALNRYRSSHDVKQVLAIRPWSFPSSLHRSWDNLEPFSCKASRNRFPPIYDFEEPEE
ncbi:MAG: hypothetical protein C4K47_00775 [Candidatus Thorarchaeota archaeon]|nr:MAG: hypothetical protein C4K47_00775 [Candidatus Thorarchaeota archaeon]